MSSKAQIRQDQIAGTATSYNAVDPSSSGYIDSFGAEQFTASTAESNMNTLADDMNRIRTIIRHATGGATWYDQFGADAQPHGVFSRRNVMRGCSIALNAANRSGLLSYDGTLNELAVGLVAFMRPNSSTPGVDGHFSAHDYRYASNEITPIWGVIVRVVGVDTNDSDYAKYHYMFDVCTSGDTGLYRLNDGAYVQPGVKYYLGKNGAITTASTSGIVVGYGVFNRAVTSALSASRSTLHII